MKKLIILIIIGLGGCSPVIRTYYDFDKEDDISKYKSFAWQDLDPKEMKSNPLYYNELNDKRIRVAANDLLQAKGYVFTDHNPELTLHYHIATEEHSVLVPDPNSYWYGDYFMHPDIMNYREGTLIIDLMNTKTKSLVWRGWAVATMDAVLYDTKDNANLIRSAVTKILQNLPRRNR